MRWPCSGIGSARGCGRVTISISSPPTPMPVMSERVTGKPASRRISTQSKPFSFGRARAAGRAKHRPAVRIRDQHQIARIDRHAEMLDAPADRFDRRGDHVARSAIADAPNTTTSLGAGLEHLVERLRERLGLVRHALLGDDRRAGGRETLRGDPQGLLDHLVGEARQHGRDDADLAQLERRDADDRLCGARSRNRRVARRPAPQKE